MIRIAQFVIRYFDIVQQAGDSYYVVSQFIYFGNPSLSF